MLQKQILKRDTIQFLNKELNLPATGQEQDWDIELADAQRIKKFLAFYENKELTIEQRSALMALILASLEDLAHEQAIDAALWNRIARILLNDYAIHKSLINYWSLAHEADPHDLFAISVLLRSLHGASISKKTIL